MRCALLVLALTAVGCSKTSERAAGTENPAVETPVELPPSAAAPLDTTGPDTLGPINFPVETE